MAKLEQINVGGLLPATVWEMETASASQIDAVCGLGRGVNLLDNWYFADPINQRNITSLDISNSVYTIDRWYSYLSHLELVSGGISYYSNSTDGYIAQKIEGDFRGLVVTFSVLYDGKLRSETITIPTTMGVAANSNFVDNIRLSAIVGTANWTTFLITTNNTTPKTLTAAKVEFGTVQTLAHQDASGNWVLNNPPPNYALELAKCQRYQVELVYKESSGWGMVGIGFASLATIANAFIPLPVPLRAKPAITLSGNFCLKLGNANITNLPAIPAMRLDQVTENGVSIVVETTGLTPGETYQLWHRPATEATGKNSLLLDANL